MDKLKIHILRRLYRWGKIGASYVPLEKLMFGLPPDQKDMKQIHRAVKELHNEGFLLLWKKGDTASLNPTALDKVKELIF